MGSSDKLSYNLDNFFARDAQFTKAYPRYTETHKPPEKNLKICQFSSPKISWEWALDGLTSPVHFFDQKCTARQYHIFKNYLLYTEAIEKKKDAKLITFENVDNLLYPEKWDHLGLKIMDTNQENVLSAIKAKTEQELAEDMNDISVDFSDTSTPLMKVTVKDRLKIHPELQEKIKEWDEDHLNILNIFVDTVSRPRFYRRLKKTARFLAGKKYDVD